MRVAALLLLSMTAACAARVDEDPWHFDYRVELPQAQGCTVVGTRDPELVRLEGTSCEGERAGWCHPCQDGTPGLCPDVSAPGNYVDVYSRGGVDPADSVIVEACR